MRWWGWGEEGHDVAMPEAATALLREEIGADPGIAPRRPVTLEEVRLPAPRLPGAVRERLAAAVGIEHVRDDREARVSHAAGRSYPDLVRLRSGDGSSAPDAVLLPGSSDQVRAALTGCSDQRVAVSIDLRRLDRVVSIDRISLTARLEAGLTGPQVERALGAEGLTLGHFPQSFEYSTVGGWVATRSAGQASTGFGRIDELVDGLRLVAPAGEVDARALPASGAGPDLRELLIGSEGVLGVICDATLCVRQAPNENRYEGWWFGSFAEGRDAFRVMEQADASPDVARLSDEAETRFSLVFASLGGAVERVGRAYLRARGRESGCLAIVGFEGTAEDIERRRVRTASLLRAGGGIALGRRPGELWLRGRYAGPYLRDELLDRAVLVDTLETATTWSDLESLYRATGDALRSSLAERGTPPFVMCHVSHLYRSGASLYFTFMARQDDDALAQWRAAKAAASEAIVAAGGTITHHHAVGRDHARWMRAEVGEMGLELIRAAKERLDPAGIMNPGKLLPS